MAAESVTVFIPTTGRRLEMLGRVVEEFTRQGFSDVVIVDHCSWGAGINQCFEFPNLGDYCLTCCDDTVPYEGWFDAAKAYVDRGLTPASRYVNADGSPLRQGTDDLPHGYPMSWCRSFLLTPAIFQEIGPFIDATWYADIDYSERLTKSGRNIVACDGYTFTHLNGERDWLTREEEARSVAEYDASHLRQGIERTR